MSGRDFGCGLFTSFINSVAVERMTDDNKAEILFIIIFLSVVIVAALNKL